MEKRPEPEYQAEGTFLHEQSRPSPKGCIDNETAQTCIAPAWLGHMQATSHAPDVPLPVMGSPDHGVYAWAVRRQFSLASPANRMQRILFIDIY